MKGIERTLTTKAIIASALFFICLFWMLPVGSHTALGPSREAATLAYRIKPVLFSAEAAVNKNPQKEKTIIKSNERQSPNQNKSLAPPKTGLIKEGKKSMVEADSMSTDQPRSKKKKSLSFELIVM